jgi:hemerythrin-like domain-containing protein
MTEGLAADHRVLEASWRRLRQVLERIAAGESVALPSNEVDAFVSLYERHLKIEEEELLPMAERLLTDDDITRIGRAMRERRGIGEV